MAISQKQPEFLALHGWPSGTGWSGSVYIPIEKTHYNNPSSHNPKNLSAFSTAGFLMTRLISMILFRAWLRLQRRPIQKSTLGRWWRTMPDYGPHAWSSLRLGSEKHPNRRLAFPPRCSIRFSINLHIIETPPKIIWFDWPMLSIFQLYPPVRAEPYNPRWSRHRE